MKNIFPLFLFFFIVPGFLSGQTYLGKRVSLSASGTFSVGKLISGLNIDFAINRKTSLTVYAGKSIKDFTQYTYEETHIYDDNYTYTYSGNYNYAVKSINIILKRYRVKNGADAPYGFYGCLFLRNDLININKENLFLNGVKVQGPEHPVSIVRSLGAGFGLNRIFKDRFIAGYSFNLSYPISYNNGDFNDDPNSNSLSHSLEWQLYDTYFYKDKLFLNFSLGYLL